MAAGTVYLRTNRFEVKLEGITFKPKDFEFLCTEDFLFPKGKVWVRKPVVGIDVMKHPRDPKIVLVLLCFGLGSVILRLRTGAALPPPILKFLTDDRICFVGFGIPEKRDLFPFEQLGLTRKKSDVGYLAAKLFNSSKYKKCDLGDLARKVLGVKRMVGLADSKSFERHEQIKCGICQLFISTVIGISLFNADEKKLSDFDSPRHSPFKLNLSSLPLQSWLRLSENKNLGKDDVIVCPDEEFRVEKIRARLSSEDDSVEGEDQETTVAYAAKTVAYDGKTVAANGEANKEAIQVTKKPLKGIFKCLFPLEQLKSVNSENNNNKKQTAKAILKCPSYSCAEQLLNPVEICSPSPPRDTKKPLKGILKCPSSKTVCSPPMTTKEQQYSVQETLKRANSKGHNVSFKCD